MLFPGSDTEKEVKKAAAETEEAWSGCGQGVGLKIWRIVQVSFQLLNFFFDYLQIIFEKFYFLITPVFLNFCDPRLIMILFVRRPG